MVFALTLAAQEEGAQELLAESRRRALSRRPGSGDDKAEGVAGLVGERADIREGVRVPDLPDIGREIVGEGITRGLDERNECRKEGPGSAAPALDIGVGEGPADFESGLHGTLRDVDRGQGFRGYAVPDVHGNDGNLSARGSIHE